jgi:hypothetical protein
MRTAILTMFGLGLLGTHPALAATAEKESTYEIEVVVFENRLPDLTGDELLVRDAAQARISGLENAIAPDKAEGRPYLAPAISGLLEQDGHYRVLTHLHWMQTVDAKSVAKPVRIASANPAELEGSIRFYMSRHLHLDVNLLFRETVTAGGSEPNTAVYRLSEQRKVKSQETHYFDHPRLGVLVRVMPVEKHKDSEKK